MDNHKYLKTRPSHSSQKMFSLTFTHSYYTLTMYAEIFSGYHNHVAIAMHVVACTSTHTSISICTEKVAGYSSVCNHRYHYSYIALCTYNS